MTSTARTPVAGMIHAATLLAIVLLLAPLAHDLPLAVLAAILLFVAFSMGEWSAFTRLRQFSINYRIIMLATFRSAVRPGQPAARRAVLELHYVINLDTTGLDTLGRENLFENRHAAIAAAGSA